MDAANIAIPEPSKPAPVDEDLLTPE